MKNRIDSIEQKIQELKKKKIELEQKNVHELAKLIDKCGLADIDKTILTGALLAIANSNKQEKENWRVAGQKFLGTVE